MGVLAHPCQHHTINASMPVSAHRSLCRIPGAFEQDGASRDLMTTPTYLDGLDSRAWATATLSAPLVTQLVLVLLIASAWLLGKWFPGPALPLFAASAAGVFVLCAVATFVLIRSTSSRARGMALSVAGSYVVVLVGATLYGIWMLQW